MYQLHKIKPIAERVFELLQPHCHKIHIAGSIRREQHRVKDIEIVCHPKKAFIQTDLFGGGEYQVAEEFTAALATMTEKVERGNVEGRHMKITLKGGFPLDLFMPQPDDYFRMLLIRTGSAEYIRSEVASTWVKLGWVGVDKLGLVPIEDCVQLPDRSWRIMKDTPSAKPPAWQSEEQFFQWLKIKYTTPAEREYKQLLNPTR